MKPIIDLDCFRSQDLLDSFGGQDLDFLPAHFQSEALQSTGRHPKSKPSKSRKTEAEKRLADPTEQGFGESLETARVAHARSYTALKVLSGKIESVMREIALEWQGGKLDVAQDLCEESGEGEAPRNPYSAYATELSRCHAELLVTTKQTKSGKYYRRPTPFFSCRRRWCPICSARLTRVRRELLAVKLDLIAEEQKFLGVPLRHIFLTFTVRNCKVEDVEKTVQLLNDGLRRLTNRAFWKRQVLGYIKTLELTYNAETQEVHPHLHLLVAVTEDYFRSKDYMAKPKLIKLWRDVCRLDYDPSVDIKSVKKKEIAGVEKEIDDDDLKKAAFYVMKYQTKPHDLQDVPAGFIKALILLKGKRFADGAGIYRGIYKQIEIVNPPWEDQDFILEDDRPCVDDPVVSVAVFWWRASIERYLRRLDGSFTFGSAFCEDRMVCAVDRLSISRDWLKAGGSWLDYLNVKLEASGRVRPSRKPVNPNPWAGVQWDYSGTLDIMAAESGGQSKVAAAGGQSKVAVADGYDDDLPW
jgi:plasmid rolling circle replication initiator protein Rep